MIAYKIRLIRTAWKYPFPLVLTHTVRFLWFFNFCRFDVIEMVLCCYFNLHFFAYKGTSFSYHTSLALWCFLLANCLILALAYLSSGVFIPLLSICESPLKINDVLLSRVFPFVYYSFYLLYITCVFKLPPFLQCPFVGVAQCYPPPPTKYRYYLSSLLLWLTFLYFTLTNPAGINFNVFREERFDLMFSN